MTDYKKLVKNRKILHEALCEKQKTVLRRAV